MTNWDKLKEMMDIEEVREYINPFCDAIHKLRKEEMCKITCEAGCERCKEWLKQEYKPQILDKAEKKYLSNVIKPFRDRVEGIVKPRKIFNPIECKYVSNGQEYIAIKIKHESNITLPFFPEGTMYKGMKAGKLYTLEELGI